MRVAGFSKRQDSTLGNGLGRFAEGPLTREVLVRLKTRGLRGRVWYWALDRVERGLVDLTIRWVDKVRSRKMTATLLRILEKLERALDKGMGRVLGRGRMLAEKLSNLAVEWGNRAAFYWRFDPGYCRALGLSVLSLKG